MPGETEPLGNTFVDEAPPAFPPDASANEVICRLIHEILACLPSQDDNPFGEVLSKLREILATHTDVESDLGRLFDQPQHCQQGRAGAQRPRGVDGELEEPPARHQVVGVPVVGELGPPVLDLAAVGRRR